MLFTKHPQRQVIRQLLFECSKLEKDILAMQMTDTPEMEEVYKVIFFDFLPLKQLNYNELFLNTKSAVFDRNRVYGGFGYQINKNIRVEAGYMTQLFETSSRDQFNLITFVNF